MLLLCHVDVDLYFYRYYFRTRKKPWEEETKRKEKVPEKKTVINRLQGSTSKRFLAQVKKHWLQTTFPSNHATLTGSSRERPPFVRQRLVDTAE